MEGRQATFVAALSRFQRVAVDTSCCVYFLGRARKWRGLVDLLFNRASRLNPAVRVPGIVRLELLVYPYRRRDADDLIRVRQLFEGLPGVTASPVSEEVLVASARIRALAALRVPDSMVIGSALAEGCDAVVGNDRNFRVLQRLPAGEFADIADLPEYIHLDDFVD